MPIYEYECRACHHRFEKRQRFDAEPAAICPNCQGKARRVIHSAPIIFKGSGFYITDHRNPSDTEKGRETMPDKKKGE